ncbi:trans-aconitate 2-methyltransferase [Pseudonocardia sp. WMMC193]|uniref:class I SAM-dependent methyltransferase n=1 Tax=Pseudonocardia sp. WMMC193 TaxID=2911965 RepID=UPI001F1639A7|nr:class I SAM-dependent methyltransferase [Pseudonocardia sp. WMMC193]MCF7551115.1 hypothetical protein [Pseudonocardia sp. WMMC193]
MNATETDTRAQPHAADGSGQPARAFDRLLRNNPTFREQLQLSVHRMGLTGTGKRLLIIGAGSGAAVQGVPEEAPGWRVVAVDESHELTRHAQSEDWPPDYWFVTATLYNLGDALARRNLPGPFDAILVAYEMRHQRNLDDTLAYLRDLLVPGAPLAVHEYSVRGNRAARRTWAATCLAYLARIRTHGRVPGMGEYLWRSVTRFDSVTEFRERLGRARFTDIRVQTFGGRMEHVLHTFLARAPVHDDRGGPDDLGLPFTDAPAPRGPRPGPGVRGRVVLPAPRAVPEPPSDGEPRSAGPVGPLGADADPEAETPPQGLRAVPDPPAAGFSSAPGEAAGPEAGRAPEPAPVEPETDAGRPDGEAVRSRPAQPEVVQSESVQSESVRPEVVRPEVVRPEVVQSQPTRPESAQPASQPASEPASEAAPEPAPEPARVEPEPAPFRPTPAPRSPRSEVRAVAPSDPADPFELDDDEDLAPAGERPGVREREPDGRDADPLDEVPPLTDAPQQRPRLRDRFTRAPKPTRSDGAWLTRAEREDDPRS